MAAIINHDRWHDKDARDPHSIVHATVKDIENESSRHERNKRYMAKYLNRPAAEVGLRPGEGGADSFTSPLALNALHSAVSTVASKICMQRPRPFFLTNNGSYEDQERAKLLQKFVQGVFSQNKVYQSQAPRAFLDSMLMDIGALKVSPWHGRIKVERANADHIIVDESAKSTEPRDLYQLHYPSRGSLMRDPRFKKLRGAIQAAGGAPGFALTKIVDVVQVVEGWHLPSYPGAGDGRHILAMDNEVLALEPWGWDRYPFAFQRWDERLDSFYGLGLMAQGLPIQLEIDKTIQRIQDAMHLLAVTWVKKRPNAKDLKTRQLKNMHGLVVPDGYEVESNAAINPEWLKYLDYLYLKLFEISGVSQLSATSRKPTGADSGVALRTLLDTETQRFALAARNWEEIFADAARLIVKTACDMGGATTRYADRDFVGKIDFSDCRLDEDRFDIDIYPTSMLPQTPAGKLATVQDLMSLGVITEPEQAASYLELPDLEKYSSLETANYRAAQKLCEHILSGGKARPPEKFMNLGLFVSMGQKYYVKGQIDGVPDSRLSALADWMDEAQSLIQEDMEAQAELAQQMNPASVAGVPPQVASEMQAPIANVA